MGARPPRWLKCPRKSVIIRDKFIAFKTFLDEKFDSQVPDEDRFDFSMLNSYVKGNNKELGLIIDLTNTKRFYNKDLVEKNGIRYVKLQCRGRGESPNEEQTALFIRMSVNYFERNPGKIIGVHCTHGFNRTGYMITAYFCQHEEWAVEDAATMFSTCRPPGIYKGDYIRELFLKYGGPDPAPPPPQLPEWCFEEQEGGSDDDDSSNKNNENNGGGSGDEKRAPKKRRLAYNENAKFAEEFDAITTVAARGAERVQEICESMLDWTRGNFPGSQPVSLDRQNIELLSQKPYKVTWKADGTRYMMLILKEEEVYFIDRDNSIFVTDKLHFPRRKNPAEHIQNTLVDGELVMDKEGDQLVPRFLIYDIVKFEGQDVGKTDLDRRMLCIDKELIKPRCDAMKAGKIEKQQEPFSVRKKDFWPVEKSTWVLDKLIPQIPHETDGLILQPLLDPYIPGTCHVVMKWKPPDLNSVDFLLTIVTLQNVGCLREKVGYLYVQGYDQPFSKIKLTPELKHYDKRIIECTWDKPQNQWKFLRIREDKSFPNALKTATSVCESIKNPVTKDNLSEYINNFGFRHTAPKT